MLVDVIAEIDIKPIFVDSRFLMYAVVEDPVQLLEKRKQHQPDGSIPKRAVRAIFYQKIRQTAG